MPIEQLLNADTIVIVAVMAIAGLVALVLLQGAGLRRRFDEMLQENSVAHATLRRAADRLACIQVEKTGVERDETSITLPNHLHERLDEMARRGDVPVKVATSLALERVLADFDSELFGLALTAGIERGQGPAADQRQPAPKDVSGGH